MAKIKKIWIKIRVTLKEYWRVLKLTKKPTWDEFKVIVKISSIGIGIIGSIGFMIAIIKQLFF
jgi:protein transport protein SEC61 subunit gamma-like protein